MRRAQSGWRAWILAGLMACATALVWAEDSSNGELVHLESARASTRIPVFLHATAGATATLVLLPGGAGGIGRLGANGWPDGGNFLIRSGPLLAAQGFHLAMVARPSDQSDMGYPFRIGAEHIADLARVLQLVRATWPQPVWLVGTSRGTVSATAAAIALRDQGLIDGLVLTSSVVRASVTGAVPTQDLKTLRLPVLLLHHRHDACKFCAPGELPAVLRGLSNASARSLLWVDSAEGVTGDPCEAQHYHGFKGAESIAVQMIADWIRNPRN